MTLAERLMVTDILVIRRGMWFPVPKYRGTNASHITHVVYIVKPGKAERFIRKETLVIHRLVLFCTEV